MIRPYKIILLLLLAVFAGSVYAANASAGHPDARIAAVLAKVLPGLKPDSIAPGPIKGMYEVTFGPRIVYITADGHYLITGDIFDTRTGTAITQQRETELKSQLLAKLDPKDMIIFGSSKLPYTVTVFTDIDCGYCRLLHSKVAEYNKDGIRIRYLAFPRAGLNSPSAEKANSVWCAPDRQQALTDAMSGKPVAKHTCNSPVAADYRLGQEFGVNGTPTIVLADGTMLPGYVPPARLAALLQEMAASPDSQK